MPGWSLPHNANGRVRRLDCAPAASVATPVRIDVGVAGAFVLAIRGGVELCAVAGLGDHRSLRQRRCCDDTCEDGRSKELEGRHWLGSFSVTHGDYAQTSILSAAPPGFFGYAETW